MGVGKQGEKGLPDYLTVIILKLAYEPSTDVYNYFTDYSKKRYINKALDGKGNIM